MPKSNKRKKLSERKSHKRARRYLEGGGDSQYARKKTYCHKNGVWGFDVPEPKPWKKRK